MPSKKFSGIETLDSDDKDLLLEFVSLKLYENMVDIYEILVKKIGEREANDILVNAISVNLGHVIGQLDPKQQKRYATVARAAIKEHMLMGAMQKDLHAHGQIGHA